MPGRESLSEVRQRSVRIPTGAADIDGDLTLPTDPAGVVLFAHGSGSGRHSPRNRYVARALCEAGLATLHVDLLTEAEERVDALTREHRFDIGLLAARVCATIGWLGEQARTEGLPVGLFGASTGAAAALVAAAERNRAVAAVVSRGGRPDLAGPALGAVLAPTLLIVGGLDDVVIRLNREAMGRMEAETALEVVPGATHLFEEPGKLERVVELAGDWFGTHLQGRKPEVKNVPR
ncbi:MAG TPA: dienelactone hydrolase family protein [Trueperaceae bacterium]